MYPFLIEISTGARSVPIHSVAYSSFKLKNAERVLANQQQR